MTLFQGLLAAQRLSSSLSTCPALACLCGCRTPLLSLPHPSEIHSRVLWSSLGTPSCCPSTHTLEQSAHCSQHRSWRGFWEQCSPPITQHTGDSCARPCSDSGRAVLVASIACCHSLHSGSSPAHVWLWGCVQASPWPGATGGFCPCTDVALPRGLLHQHGRLPSFTSGPLCMVPPRPRSPLSAWPSPPHLRLRSLSSEPFSAEHPLVGSRVCPTTLELSFHAPGAHSDKQRAAMTVSREDGSAGSSL